jgi:hypothetical protein
MGRAVVRLLLIVCWVWAVATAGDKVVVRAQPAARSVRP